MGWLYAEFLGFMTATEKQRRKYYGKVYALLEEEERAFWNHHPGVFDKGPVRKARFEKYIAKFDGVASQIVGGKNLYCLIAGLSASRG